MNIDLEKEIREVIEFHCGGTYPKRQKATEIIMQMYKDQQLHIRVVRCFKIKAQAIKKSIWTYVFLLAKEADKVKNFITR